MCNKAVDASSSAIQFVPECYKTREICDKAVDDFLPTLKFVPNWFISNKILEGFYDNLFSLDDINFVSEDSNNVTCFW